MAPPARFERHPPTVSMSNLLRVSPAYALRIFLVTIALLPLSSHGAERDVVNWARLSGCPGSAGRAPLQHDARLDRAALLMAHGRSLPQSLHEAGYLAGVTSALHISGAYRDADVDRALVTHECSSLTDPKLMQYGTRRSGTELWMVLAAPVWVPSTREAPAIAAKILTLVNAARENQRRCGGKVFSKAAPLILNRALTVAALAQSKDMAQSNHFDHRGQDGSTPSMRIVRAGFGAYEIVGENIAAGAMTPEEVTAGWLASPPHCENIMDSRFTEIGIAFAVNSDSRELVYWTQDFAKPRR